MLRAEEAEQYRLPVGLVVAAVKFEEQDDRYFMSIAIDLSRRCHSRKESGLSWLIVQPGVHLTRYHALRLARSARCSG